MNKLTTILLLTFLGIANITWSQINSSTTLKDLNKKVSTTNTKQAVSTVKNTSTAGVLSALDNQLKNKFKLDGVKSELSGETLKVRAASAAYAKLPASLRNTQGNRVLDATTQMLSGDATLKSLNVKTVAIDMVRDMSVGKVIQSFSKTVAK
ncbi:MAG: hypothetical protein Q8R57_04185 [Bacteroidota bacterium]|nr:hypothetical protein [Bacteroidota bacterium]